MSIEAIKWGLKTLKGIPKEGLPSLQRCVLLALCSFHHHQTGDCYPSYDTIGQVAGCSRRTAITAIKGLIEVGLISKDKRRHKGHQGSNQYRLFGRFAPPPE